MVPYMWTIMFRIASKARRHEENIGKLDYRPSFLIEGCCFNLIRLGVFVPSRQINPCGLKNENVRVIWSIYFSRFLSSIGVHNHFFDLETRPHLSHTNLGFFTILISLSRSCLLLASYKEASSNC